LGHTCMHGPSECLGNMLQLCAQRYWPVNVGSDGVDVPALNRRHVWIRFLDCVGHFNSTAESAIPGNSQSCLASLGVPQSVQDQIYSCATGPEGQELLTWSVKRSLEICGPHSSAERKACKSCSVFLDSQPVCVMDGGEWYNCSSFANPTDVNAWVDKICDLSAAKDGSVVAPTVCRLSHKQHHDRVFTPHVVGHVFGSTDPEASALFAERYFGARILENRGANACQADGKPTPHATHVKLPKFSDYRGGGMEISFVFNPRKKCGAPLPETGQCYGVEAHVAAMKRLYGNLSDNTGHHWNQFFDAHLGFYVPRFGRPLAEQLIEERVPFFTTPSSGIYESIYVVIPGTGMVVELLGDFAFSADANGNGVALPENHIRLGSTQQFCTPKRRLAQEDSDGVGPEEDPWSDIFGRGYGPAGFADVNKTTMFAPAPRAVADFGVAFLGASRLQQHRGAAGDVAGHTNCAELAWVQWPDGHQWHVVNTKQTDWVTIDGLRPNVPFNISELADYIEDLRLTRQHKLLDYDQWMDYRDIFEVQDLSVAADLLVSGGVAFGIWSTGLDAAVPQQKASCSLLANIPQNGLIVELRSSNFGAPGSWLADACATRPFDLCSATHINEASVFV